MFIVIGIPRKFSVSAEVEDFSKLCLKWHNLARLFHGSPSLIWEDAIASSSQGYADHLSTVQVMTICIVSSKYFSVARRFFSKHKTNTDLESLSDDDFEALLRLCLLSDSVLIDGSGYKQKSGLAMGNNLAPSLAIIYMNELDLMMVDKTEGKVKLKRFIDDYFALLLSQQISEEGLLTLSNNLNDAIKFTLELPNNNNELPYLDTHD